MVVVIVKSNIEAMMIISIMLMSMMLMKVINEQINYTIIGLLRNIEFNLFIGLDVFIFTSRMYLLVLCVPNLCNSSLMNILGFNVVTFIS